MLHVVPDWSSDVGEAEAECSNEINAGDERHHGETVITRGVGWHVSGLMGKRRNKHRKPWQSQGVARCHGQ